MSITYTLNRSGFDQATRLLLEGVEDLGRVTDQIAALLENSIRRNFREGGRPQKWQPSKRSESQSGQTLIDTARLMNSIVGEGFAQQVKVGTNVDYAAAHQFGVDKQISQQVQAHTRRITQAFGREIPLTEVKVRSHTRSIHMKLPARPFMMIQNEDWEDIEELITNKMQSLVTGEK